MRGVAFAAMLLISSMLQSAPPEIKLPLEVHAQSGTFIIVQADTPAKTVKWVILDSGMTQIPSSLLRDSKSAVLMAPKGRYRLLAYCAVADEASEPAIVTIIVDGSQPPPTQPDPPKPPDNPPPPPETPPLAKYWTVVIQPDGPIHPDLAKNLKDAAWDRLRKRGVQTFRVEASLVHDTYKADVTGLPLPGLLILREKPDGKAELVSKQALPSAEKVEQLVGEYVK
jgi:hypothetical protein